MLTPEEELIDQRTAALRFDASTGAAAALIAAANRPAEVRAVVSCGGRPDLAVAHLHGMLEALRLTAYSSSPPSA